MSLDTKYLIQYEGPFGRYQDGRDEWKEQLKKLNALPNSYGFEEIGYDTIIGYVKHSADEEIIGIAKESTPIQILKRQDGGFWDEIFNVKIKK